MNFDNTRFLFYLKYWLAEASMALWQGKSCPWTHSTTSISSLFTRRVSIPLWSSAGRPPSSQWNSLKPAWFSPSSFGLESSPLWGKGQSVVLSSEPLIFRKLGIFRRITCSFFRYTCISKKAPVVYACNSSAALRCGFVFSCPLLTSYSCSERNMRM